ncbi:MAG: cas2 [Desulfomicrobiaceae bacterium]|jgi:CRISPR-associated protein Cas2|nr:cas2 [Desulfomicrobiaceae bacterium]
MEHLFIVTYDITNPRRWRRVFRIMNGFGQWLQLSVFQCRLDRRREVELRAALQKAIRQQEDHVLIIDLGPAERIRTQISSLGKEFTPIERKPIIV